MYNYKKAKQTTITINKSYEGETLEHKVDRILNDKEPITDGAPLIYTERIKGVNPNYDPRTDRWEYGLEEMTALSKSNTARRQSRIDKILGKDKTDGGAEPTQATTK